jgi:hypothetical protein
MTEQDRSEPPGEPLGGELVRAAPTSMREWAEQVVTWAREDGVALTGEGRLLTDLMRHVLRTGLEVEMAEHLGYERGEARPAVSATPATAATTRPSRPRSARSSCGSRATTRARSSRPWSEVPLLPELADRLPTDAQLDGELVRKLCGHPDARLARERFARRSGKRRSR